MKTNWWENFFHGIALDFWRAVISDEQTRAEADFIEKHLQLLPGGRVLDVPSGNGRLSLDLARRGYALTGVDIAVEFVEEAKRRSEEFGLSIDWHNRDMRELPWTDEFDGAFCFGNSFGYLDDQENADFLKAVSRTLKPGARFIVDAPAIAECLLPVFQPHRSIERAGITVEIDSRYDAEQGRAFNEFTFIRNGLEDKRPSSQRIYTYKALTELLQAAGLETVAAYSSLSDEPFEPGAQRLLLISEKRRDVSSKSGGKPHFPTQS